MRPVVEYTREQASEMSIEAAFRVPGNIIEFGVFEGASTRAIVNKLRALEQANPDVPRKTVYACDSFEGLPEQWETLDVGTFKCEVPGVPGAAIVRGFLRTR
jgi:macrocin-O-methyltransferase TylF-like protien